jgi:tripartite-type tricarboxylate transporter receptor subunit TctC
VQQIMLSALTLALAIVGHVPQARAEDFPSHPLHLIIGFPPGSAADITARLVGDAMGQTLRQQIVVESRPGAGSSIAAEFVIRAPADGYTLYIGTSSNLTSAAISSNVHFDFGKDFAPVTPLSRSSWRFIRHSVSQASRSSSSSQGPNRASSLMPPSGRVRSRISRLSFSACKRTSSSFMCPTRAALRQ